MTAASDATTSRDEPARARARRFYPALMPAGLLINFNCTGVRFFQSPALHNPPLPPPRAPVVLAPSSSPPEPRPLGIRVVPPPGARRDAHELVEIPRVSVATPPPLLPLVEHRRSRVVRASVVRVIHLAELHPAPRVATRPQGRGVVPRDVVRGARRISAPSRRRRRDVIRLRLRARRMVAAEEALRATRTRGPRVPRRRFGVFGVVRVRVRSGWWCHALTAACIAGGGRLRRDLPGGDRRAPRRGGGPFRGLDLGVPPAGAPGNGHELAEVVRLGAAAAP